MDLQIATLGENAMPTILILTSILFLSGFFFKKLQKFSLLILFIQVQFALLGLINYGDECGMYYAEISTYSCIIFELLYIEYISLRQRAAYQGKKDKLDKWWITSFWITLCFLLKFYSICFRSFLSILLYLPILFILCVLLYHIYTHIKKSQPEYYRFFWNFMFILNTIFLIAFLFFIHTKIPYINSQLKDCKKFTIK